MAAQSSGKAPTKKKGETPAREATEVEREASSGDTERDPGEERRSQRTERKEDTETDEDVE